MAFNGYDVFPLLVSSFEPNCKQRQLFGFLAPPRLIGLAGIIFAKIFMNGTALGLTLYEQEHG